MASYCMPSLPFSKFIQNDGREGSGLIELSLIEAKDLVAADLRGTSDPYVRVQYGNIKRRTKVWDLFRGFLLLACIPFPTTAAHLLVVSRSPALYLSTHYLHIQINHTISNLAHNNMTYSLGHFIKINFSITV